jgi:nucleotide-binding universal stress UspA family protein
VEIRSILVNFDIDSFSPELLKCAGSLAKRFNADLIGMSAAEPSPGLVGVEGSVALVGWYAQEREEIETRLRAIEEQFRSLAPADVKVDWRAYVDAPSRSLASAACCADLIVTGSHIGSASQNYQRSLDVGELVLTAGRPVLVVAAGIAEIRADKIVVGWKDAREARRAVSDALPFLKAASDVVVITISEGDLGAERASLDELLAWLHRHEVKARGEVYPTRDGAADTLEATAKLLAADLVVTGGYGHNRLREWLFGGMTRDLLADQTINRFMSN